MFNKRNLFIFGFLFLLVIDAGAKEMLDPIQAKGSVDTKEIGGRGLSVISLWSKAIIVDESGRFTTVVSNLRPQKLFLVDIKKNTRALAISLPDSSNNIVFDAKSTAVAFMFKDAVLFGSTARAKAFIGSLEGNRAFLVLVSYFKSNLKEKTLEELALDNTCVELVDKCNADIFGQNRGQINNSLKSAEKELSRVLSE